MAAARRVPPFSALLVILLLAACANPVPPSGGPRDETPPALERTLPANASTDVERETVEITFTEYVDVASFAQSLSVTPPVDGRIEYDWRGRSVTIEFPQPLRDSTTYILTIGTELRDERGVALEQPLRLAFATGPTIDRGRLSGRVVRAATGQPFERIDVFAYAAPDSTLPAALPERPVYRTQTGADGTFTFEYLRAQPYYVVAVEDLNRSRQADPLEAFAVPPRPVFFASEDTTDVPARAAVWVAAVRDAQPPRTTRLQALADTRLVLRYDEPVRLAAPGPAGWTLTDSLAGRERPVEALYQQASPAAEVFLRTAPLEERLHRLAVPAGAVTDTSGNASPEAVARVTPTAADDTVRTRFLGFVPAAADTAALLPGVRPGLRFNQPVDTARLRTALAVEDTSGTPRLFALATTDGTTYRLRLTPPLPEAPVRVRFDARGLVDAADTTYARTFRTLTADELGALSGVARLVDPADTTAAVTPDSLEGPIRVVLIPVAEGRLDTRRVTADPATGAFRFDGVPGSVEVRYRLFLDRDGDGRWDAGRILPYRPAEPITWRAEPIESRARWDVALPDTLRLPLR